MSDRLSALDAMFLALENHANPLHVGGVFVLDRHVPAQHLHAVLAEAMAKVPRARQRLLPGPHPSWVNDPSFELSHHLHHRKLPAPGDGLVLREAAGDIFSHGLDREHPLWEMWTLDGLEGKRMAIVCKVHHSMVDGQAGVQALVRALGGTESPPTTTKIHRPLLHEGWLHDLMFGLRSLVPELRPASPTPLNPHQIGPRRRLGWLELDLDELRAIASHFGGTLNDVMLSVLAGALGRYIEILGDERAPKDLRALVPVGRPHHGARFATGNEVSFMIARLAAADHDPVHRLATMIAHSRAVKRSRQSFAVEMVERLAEWTAPSLLASAAKMVCGLRPFNVVITNVPGPRAPLAIGGARIVEIHPVVPLFLNVGLGIALLSYQKRLSCSVSADADLLQHLDPLLETIRREVQRLAAASRHPPRVAA